MIIIKTIKPHPNGEASIKRCMVFISSGTYIIHSSNTIHKIVFRAYNVLIKDIIIISQE